MRQRCVACPAPRSGRCRAGCRMEHGTTEEQLARIAQVSQGCRAQRQTRASERSSLWRRCWVGDGGAIRSGSTRSARVMVRRRWFSARPSRPGKRTSNRRWVAASTVATARFDDGITPDLVAWTLRKTFHSEAALAVSKALEQAGVGALFGPGPRPVRTTPSTTSGLSEGVGAASPASVLVVRRFSIPPINRAAGSSPSDHGDGCVPGLRVG